MATRDFLEQVKSAGVVGAGGAGFPTHVKLNTQVDHLIINGVECEPLLRVDQELMAAFPFELMEAAKAIKEHLGATHGHFALKGQYKQAIAALQPHIQPLNDWDLVKLDSFYPAGDEQVLVYEVLQTVVPEGGIPLNVDAVVLNVETLLNIYNALQGQSVTDKYLTVTGAIEEPMTLKVPIGTPISSILHQVAANTNGIVIIDGGPMMGKVVSPSDSVTKTTKAIIIVPAGHPLLGYKIVDNTRVIRAAMSVCCTCRQCTDMCPRYLLGHGLEPHKTMTAVAYGKPFSAKAITQAFLCSECGVCDAYACPMGLSPRALHVMLKQQLTAGGIKNPHHAIVEQSRRERSYRQVPTLRLLNRLRLTQWDVPAPLRLDTWEISEVRLPLKQHIGQPAVVTVSIGEQITKGDLIATAPTEGLGASIHASITGTVISTNPDVVIRAEGRALP
ncbi:MAG: 4Fe-4S dicluster domain-containing protein [Limnochordia bacterium]|nr:4Fe-4S dicluster domain-containing protein [Limnochordia bacterium]